MMDGFCFSSTDNCAKDGDVIMTTTHQSSSSRRGLFAFWKSDKTRKSGKAKESRTPPATSINPADDDNDDILAKQEPTDIEASSSSHDPTRIRRGSMGSTSKQHQQQKLFVLKSDPRSYWISRILILSLVTGLIALFVLAFLQWQDQHDDNDADSSKVLQQFDDYSLELLEHVKQDFVSQLQELEALEQVISASVLEQTTTDTPEEAAFWCTKPNDLSVCTTWPFVTLPFLEDYVATSSMFQQTTATVSLYPLVSNELASTWKTYAINNGLHWVEEAYETQDRFDDMTYLDEDEWFASEWSQRGVTTETDFSASLFGIATEFFRVNNGQAIAANSQNSLFFPQWQAAPLSPKYHSQVNWNLASDADLTINMLQSSEALFQTSPESNDGVIDTITTTLMYPILENDIVVARLGFDISWSDRLRAASQSLSKSVGPMVAIVYKQDSNRTFAFEIDGDNVRYIEGSAVESLDLYDFASQELASLGESVQDLLDENAQDTENSRSYSGAPLSSQFDTYSIRIHPSADFETSESNDKSVLMAIIISVLSVAALAAFVAYGFLVRKRQRALKQSAIQADAVVSSLFPSQVKEQLYEQQVQERRSHQHRRNSNEGASTRRNSNEGSTMGFNVATRRNSNETTSAHGGNSTTANNTATDITMDTTSNHDDDDLSIVSNLANGPPIASFYPSATILFADIAGFTKWSAERQPTEVFEFLERLYGGFDAAALSHGIFKIETIGDCYVAVCGLPEPCSDHAVCMVQFAKVMLTIFQEVLNELGERLEANNLALRTGIHSGPVTAGVLRGEKARFQLFGDTVNTTARHESSGKPGRIHISKATAELLVQAGHCEWIRPRRNKVNLKGKGKLSTWWVNTGEETALTEASEQVEWAWSSMFGAACPT